MVGGGWQPSLSGGSENWRSIKNFWKKLEERIKDLTDLNSEETYGTLLLMEGDQLGLNFSLQSARSPVLANHMGRLRSKPTPVERSMGARKYKEYLTKMNMQANGLLQQLPETV